MVEQEDNTVYIELIGGRFLTHTAFGTFEIRITDSSHPTTVGIADFEIADELHLLDGAPEGVTVLGEAEWEGVPRPMLYTKQIGDGKVAYLAPGHDEEAWENQSLRGSDH